jgi:subtilisin family serine protease
MRRSVLVFCIAMGMVCSAHARALDPGVTCAQNRFIIRTWPEFADLSPTWNGETVVVADSELTALNAKWGIAEVEPLFLPATADSHGVSLELRTYWRFWLGSGAVTEDMLDEFAEASTVELVEPVAFQPVCYQPDDPAYISQWYLQASAEDHDIDAPEAWSLQRGHANAIIGLMDTGVQYEHPDLAANIWINEAEMNGLPNYDDDGNGRKDDYYGWDFIVYEMVYPGEDGRYTDNAPTDFVGHGTHVAGIAASVLNNATGVSGISGGGSGFEGARIMVLRIGWLGADGNAYVAMDYAAQAIEYGRQKGVTVFSCAWSSSYQSALLTAVTRAVDDGIVFCVAAGNSNSSVPYYLSGRGDCIDIAATDDNDIKTVISNYGDWVDISAPGQSIYSTYSDHYTNTYGYGSGTSMASAMATGAVALIRSQRPEWRREQITAALLAGVDDIYDENPAYVGLLGSGRLNLNLALLNTISYTLSVPNGGETWIPGDSAMIAWESDGLDGGVVVSLSRAFPDGEWEDLFVGTPAMDTLHVAVTEPVCSHARLRIISQLSPMVGDTSDSDFTIGLSECHLRPFFTLRAPESGAELYIDDWFPIQWTTSNSMGTVTLSLDRNYPNGAWEDILLHTADDGCSFWKVEGPPCTNARLRIISDDFPSEGDTTEGSFSISFQSNSFAPSIEVRSPNGGEVWYDGEEKKIMWYCNGDCDSVIIMVCDDYHFPNGPCETILITPNDFKESWVVSHETTPRARILVVCSDVKESADESDSPFAIVGAPQVVAGPRDLDIVLRWRSTGARYYIVRSSPEPFGAFPDLEIVTADTFFIDERVLRETDSKFYQVQSSSTTGARANGNGAVWLQSAPH